MHLYNTRNVFAYRNIEWAIHFTKFIGKNKNSYDAPALCSKNDISEKIPKTKIAGSSSFFFILRKLEPRFLVTIKSGNYVNSLVTLVFALVMIPNTFSVSFLFWIQLLFWENHH